MHNARRSLVDCASSRARVRRRKSKFVAASRCRLMRTRRRVQEYFVTNRPLLG